MRFVHQTLPQRVVFPSGDSPAAVAREIEALGRSKARRRHRKAVGPIMAAIPGNNPRTVTEDSLTALLQAAWAGEEPS